MTNTLTVPPSSNIVQKGDNLDVDAGTPDEMKQANQALIAWCEHKIKQLWVDYIELSAAWKSAQEKKWKFSTLKRHAEMANKRITFFEKIKKALQLGFYIVPSFPVTMFAVRTDRKKPLKLISTSSWDTHEQKNLQPIPEGEGEYQNPFPIQYQRVIEKDDKGNPKKTQYWAEEFQELDFPITMAKPKIMEAVDRTMALKLFDDFGVLPSPYRKQDPLIVGRIKDPRKPGYGESRTVSFIIAWRLETATL
jgi:hypothetical protein